MFNKKQHQEDEYDDLVIADMNVEGMPWYRKKLQGEQEGEKKYDYDKDQQKYIIFGTLKAALLIASAYIVAFAALILLIVWGYSLIK